MIITSSSLSIHTFLNIATAATDIIPGQVRQTACFTTGDSPSANKRQISKHS